MSSEDGYDLQDVSSDVEINPEDLEMDGESDARYVMCLQPSSTHSLTAMQPLRGSE